MAEEKKRAFLDGELLDWLFQALWGGTEALVSKGKWTEGL